MSTFVIGDIHGGYKGLQQVLERSNFDLQEDHIIFLGDICDGWSQTRECMDMILELPCDLILGNHDQMFLDYMRTGHVDSLWRINGGDTTLKSYTTNGKVTIPDEHRRLLAKAPRYLERNGDVFVHAGLDPALSMMALQNDDVLVWDRSLIQRAFQHGETHGHWNRIFVGHTPVTIFVTVDEPQTWGNVVDMDTGAGWDGKLSMMNVDTGELFQSDTLPSLYPNEDGRMGRR